MGDRIFGAARKLSPENRNEYYSAIQTIEQKHSHATVKDLVDHIDYAVKLIGIDHVRISSDFGGGGGITGWSNAFETSNVTLELVKRGYTKDQIEKFWSGNLLRVWRDVQAFASSS